MTRRIAKLVVLYLLLGLVATWAVAWGSAVGYRTTGRVGTYALPKPPYGFALVGECLGGTAVKVRSTSGWLGGADFSLLVQSVPGHQIPRTVIDLCGVVEHPGSDLVFVIVTVESRGLPWRALRSYTQVEAVLEQFGGGGMPRYRRAGISELRGGKLIAGQSLSDGTVLPYLPYWPGLIADTLLYAVVFVGPHQLVGLTRRRRREKRGLCVRCGYDLSGLADGGCPECGRPNATAETRSGLVIEAR